MDERAAAAWLLRRAGLGGDGAAVDAVVERGIDGWLDDQLDPDGAGLPPAPDRWDAAQLAVAPPTMESRQHAVNGWLDRLVETPRPLAERMAWVWHDHFATSIDKVNVPWLMVAHVRTLQQHALGSFRDLLKAMTVDAAMLRWLDGETSTKRAPNENHGRELLELFAVGVENHSEDDVTAAATALTGWIVERGTGRGVFVRQRHDDTPQVLLGTRNVHDVDTVVDAACSARACAPHVTRSLARHLLGPEAAADDELVEDLAADFRRDDLEIAPLVGALLRAGLDRDDTAVLEAPVPWLVRAERTTGARLPQRLRLAALQGMGQLPMRPPDVGGWPDHTAWLSSATVLARTSAAAAVASSAPPNGAARDAARRRDLGALSTALGRAEPFSRTTVSALRALRTDTEVLALALAAPDQVVI